MKWRAYPTDVLPLWVAEMDVPLAEPVRQALDEAIERGDTGYPVRTGYAEALAEFAAAALGLGLRRSTRTASCPDVMLGVVEMLQLVTGPGDAVVVNPPVYPPFYEFLAHDWTGASSRRRWHAGAARPGRAGARRSVDAAAGPHAVVPAVQPAQPDRHRAHRRRSCRGRRAWPSEHGVRVVVDEIHAPLAYAGAAFVPYLCVPARRTAVALLSASKAWNLAGLKAAVAVAGPACGRRPGRLPEEVGHGPSHSGVIAHAAALRARHAPGSTPCSPASTTTGGCSATCSTSTCPRSATGTPEGTYLAWLDCRRGCPRPTTRPRCSSSAAGSRSTPARRSAPAAPGSCRCNFATSPGDPRRGGTTDGRLRLSLTTSGPITPPRSNNGSPDLLERRLSPRSSHNGSGAPMWPGSDGPSPER